MKNILVYLFHSESENSDRQDKTPSDDLTATNLPIFVFITNFMEIFPELFSVSSNELNHFHSTQLFLFYKYFSLLRFSTVSIYGLELNFEGLGSALYFYCIKTNTENRQLLKIETPKYRIKPLTKSFRVIAKSFNFSKFIHTNKFYITNKNRTKKRCSRVEANETIVWIVPRAVALCRHYINTEHVMRGTRGRYGATEMESQTGRNFW